MVLDKKKAYMKEYQQRPDVKIRRRDNMKLFNASSKGKIRTKKYRATEKGKVSKAKCDKKYKTKNKHIVNAHGKAQRKFKDKQFCEVKGCKEIGVKHHEDYSKPLEVNWLCLKHHGVYHYSDLTLKTFLRKEVSKLENTS